jgi:hypothetical protein
VETNNLWPYDLTQCFALELIKMPEHRIYIFLGCFYSYRHFKCKCFNYWHFQFWILGTTLLLNIVVLHMVILVIVTVIYLHFQL